MLIAILLFTNETESYSIPLKRYARMVRFQVLVATNMRMTVFCDVTPCRLLAADQRFRGAFCFHHQAVVLIVSVNVMQSHNTPMEARGERMYSSYSLTISALVGS